MATPTTEAPAGREARPEPRGPGASDRPRWGRPGWLGHDRMVRPVVGPLERPAEAAERRLGPSWWTPLVVAVATYLAAALALLAVGVVIVHTPLGEPIRSWDLSISQDLASGRTSGWNDYSDVGTSGANTWPVVAGMVLVTLVLAALRRWRDLLLVPLGLALELSMFLTVNYLVARDRPDVAQLGGEPATHSFPSGHVAATFVLWGGVVVLLGVGRWRWPWRVLAYLVAAVPVATVMFSRVYRGMHFTTDVLAGLALGVLALSGAVVATRAWALGARPARPGHAPARNEEVAP